MQMPHAPSALDNLFRTSLDAELPALSPATPVEDQKSFETKRTRDSKSAEPELTTYDSPSPAPVTINPHPSASCATDSKERSRFQLPDLPTAILQEIAGFLSPSDTLALMATNKALYQERHPLLVAQAEHDPQARVAVLIDALKNGKKQFIIDSIKNPRISGWLNIPDREGRTAGYYALHPPNLPLLALLLSYGLDPEQSFEWPQLQCGMQEAPPPKGLIKSFIKEDPSIRGAILAILKARYGDEYNNLLIDGASLSVWQYRWEQAEKDRVTSLGPLLSQLTQAQVQKDVEAMETLLADAKADPAPELVEQSPLLSAVADRNIDAIETLLAQGVDIRICAPDILAIAKSWLVNETSNDGIGTVENIQKCLRLTEILKNHYGATTFFTPFTLAYWQLLFENYLLLFRKTQVYWAVSAKNYRLAQELVEAGSEFMFDPFARPVCYELDQRTRAKRPSLFQLLFQDITSATETHLIAVKLLLSAMIEKLTPKNVNLLTRGRTLLHWLAETPLSVELLEKLCKKPGIEINLLSVFDKYQHSEKLSYFEKYHHTAFLLALHNRLFENTKILIQFGARDISIKLQELGINYWYEGSAKFFKFVNCVVDLGEQIFEILTPRDLLDHSLVQNPEYPIYLAKIISLLPSKFINMKLRKDYSNEPLAIWLADLGYASLMGPLISKGINLEVESSSGKPFHSYLHKHEKVLLLQHGANPKHLGLDFRVNSPQVFGRREWFKSTLEILIRGTPGKKINDLLDKNPISHWLTFYSRKFEWTEAELAPLVIVMMSKKVDYELFLRQALKQKHSLLLRLSIIYNPVIKQKTNLPVTSSRSSFFARLDPAKIRDITWISPALSSTSSLKSGC